MFLLLRRECSSIPEIHPSRRTRRIRALHKHVVGAEQAAIQPGGKDELVHIHVDLVVEAEAQKMGAVRQRSVHDANLTCNLVRVGLGEAVLALHLAASDDNFVVGKALQGGPGGGAANTRKFFQTECRKKRKGLGFVPLPNLVLQRVLALIGSTRSGLWKGKGATKN